jgi:hypothetical protein
MSNFQLLVQSLKKPWKKMKEFDHFAEPVHLNFGKRDKIPSSCGCILTAVAMLTVFILFCNKMVQMSSHKSPIVNYYLNENFFEFDDKVNL